MLQTVDFVTPYFAATCDNGTWPSSDRISRRSGEKFGSSRFVSGFQTERTDWIKTRARRQRQFLIDARAASITMRPMTNLITGIMLATNILATNHVEFRTNVSEYTHPTNTMSIFVQARAGKEADLIPFLKLRATNIVRFDTLEYTWNGQRVVLDYHETTLFKTQAVFELNPCKWTWERVRE